MIRKVFAKSAPYAQEKAMLELCQHKLSFADADAASSEASPGGDGGATSATSAAAAAAVSAGGADAAASVAASSCFLFPRVLGADDASLSLSLSYCGAPVHPDRLPPSCRAQVKALGAALGAAGVQHRDLVPHNVLQDGGGTLRLVDFGRARRFDRGTRGATQRRHQEEQLEQLAARLCSRQALRTYLASQLRIPEARAAPSWTQRARERRGGAPTPPSST
jgi:hypothetical protein